LQFLFERLERDPQFAPPPFDLRAAVRTQIARIVSARPPHVGGGAMAAPQFGMPSVVELGQADSTMLRAYAARLTRMLLQYEPRLARPTIVLEATGDRMAPYALVLRGVLPGQDEAEVYTFALGERQELP
jgi:predicted component of type VI protein secretion system